MGKVCIFAAISGDPPFPPTSFPRPLPQHIPNLFWLAPFRLLFFFSLCKCVWLTKLGLSQMIRRRSCQGRKICMESASLRAWMAAGVLAGAQPALRSSLTHSHCVNGGSLPEGESAFHPKAD